MTRNEFDLYCASLPKTTNVIQWGNATVWKIGGKIFAICSHWGQGDEQKIAFKCSDLSYSILIEQDDFIPAPYLARAKWVQLIRADAMTEEDVMAYIAEAYKIVCAKLTKLKRTEIGI